MFHSAIVMVKEFIVYKTMFFIKIQLTLRYNLVTFTASAEKLL